MKRSNHMMTISIVILALLTAGSALARPAGDEERIYKRLGSEVARQQDRAVDTGARADTLFLFAASGDGSYGSPGTDERGFTFDHDGECAEAGWYGLDKKAQEGFWWHLADAGMVDGHVTDMTEAGQPWTPGDTSNDYALWCGRSDVCGWTNPSGYGNNWDQYVVIAGADFADSLKLSFAYNADFEGDVWDFFQVFIDVDGVMEEIYRNDVNAEGIYQDLSVTVLADDFPGAEFGDITMRYSTDGAWADEDGLFTSDIGAVWLDNIEIIRDEVVVMQEDFESGVVPPEITFTAPAGPGDFAALYHNLFSEDICVTNVSCAWAFFDLNTTNPIYPIPVIPYGPPYLDNDVRSPILERAHAVGDPVGEPLEVGPETQVWLDYWIYYDLPENALIYQSWGVAAQIDDGDCLGPYKNDNTVYFGADKQWFDTSWNVTQYVAESAMGGTVTGLGVALNAVDMCPYWCNTNGDGTSHSPAPYFDTVRVKLISASAVSWDISVFDRFQDNFPEASTGKVRIDSCNDVGPIQGTTVVIGDSTMVELNMALVGGLQIHPNALAGELRPNLRLWFRVVAGPHAGILEPAMADQDASDGIYSPWDGTGSFNGDIWGSMVADSAATSSGVVNGKFAFDFNDEYFEPGDVIELFYRAESRYGEISTRPGWALSTQPELRSYYRVRCLPTAGADMLFCDDGNGTFFWWYEALRYNGYEGFDTYLTQAPSSGLSNGLSGRADIVDLSQYQMIVWDSAGVPSGTVTTALNADKTRDDELLTDYLSNSSHNAYLWMMGDEIANDLGNGSGFLGNVLGASLLSESLYYDDYTGVLVPKVYASHPALYVGGLEPYFWVHGGCPSLDNFSVVEPRGVLAIASHDWEDDGGTQAVAGILNRDPDGNGEVTSSAGHNNHVMFNPFSYIRVRDAGFGLDNGFGIDYARQMVGDILSHLLGLHPNAQPDDAGEVPALTALAKNFPNPFNPSTTIQFSLSSAEDVRLTVYDIGGRAVRTLVDGPMAADYHEVVWEGKDDDGNRMASGVYFYKLSAGEFSATEKMVLVK